jgi:signal transduction histidine kinase
MTAAEDKKAKPIRRTWNARLALVAYWLINLAALGVTYINVGISRWPNWNNEEVMPLLAALFLLVAAWALHEWDHAYGWNGVRDIYHREVMKDSSAVRNGGINTEIKDWIGHVLAVLSIRAGMTATIIAVLASNREKFVPVDPATVWAFIENPRAVYLVLIVAALAASLIVTLLALICNEYAICFKWQDDDTKTAFLQKADRYGTRSFYALMWALALLPVLWNYRAALVCIIAVFTFAWAYYFFPATQAVLEQKSRKAVEAEKARAERERKAEEERKRAADAAGQSSAPAAPPATPAA